MKLQQRAIGEHGQAGVEDLDVDLHAIATLVVRLHRAHALNYAAELLDRLHIRLDLYAGKVGKRGGHGRLELCRIDRTGGCHFRIDENFQRRIDRGELPEAQQVDIGKRRH